MQQIRLSKIHIETDGETPAETTDTTISDFIASNGKINIIANNFTINDGDDDNIGLTANNDINLKALNNISIQSAVQSEAGKISIESKSLIQGSEKISKANITNILSEVSFSEDLSLIAADNKNIDDNLTISGGGVIKAAGSLEIANVINQSDDFTLLAENNLS